MSILWPSLKFWSRFKKTICFEPEDTQKFIADMVHQANTASRFRFDLAICLREKDLLIGGCGIRRETELSQVANLGWAVNSEFQNKGYATEAALDMIDFSFQRRHL